ncbi:MAG: lipopolysaccharide biosynthesis protein [Candidatus Rokuibacteriota bacterium]
MRSTTETLLDNTLWHGAITVFGLAGGVLMSIVLARGLGPLLMGEYSYALWAMRTVSALATLALALGTVRYTAAAFGQANPELAAAFLSLFLRWQVLAAGVVVAVVIPLVLGVAPADLRWLLVVGAVAVFPITIESIYTNALYGARRYDLTARNTVVKTSLHLLAAIAAVLAGAGALGVLIGVTLGTVVSCLLQWRRVAHLYPAAQDRVPAATRAEMWAYLVPQSAAVALDGLVWDRSEVFFLRIYTTPEEIAFYSLAFGLAIKLKLLPGIVNGALLPTLAHLHGRGAVAEFGALYRATLRYVALTATPLAVLGIVLAPGIVTMLYGPAYDPAARLLAWLLAFSAISSMRVTAWYALGAMGDRTWTLGITLVAAALNIAAAALLIPRLGTMGAVMATGAAQVLVTLAGLLVVGRLRGCGFPFLDVARVTLAAGVALGVYMALPFGDATVPELLVAGTVTLAVFSLVCVLTGAVGSREYSIVVSATRRLMARA